MFAKRFSLGIGLLLATALFLCGCGMNERKESEDEIGTDLANGSISEYVYYGEQNDSDVKMLSCNDTFMSMTSTKDGMYRISSVELADGSWGMILYYLDYATAQEIVLCNDSSCLHNSESCMGVIKDSLLSFPALFVSQGKLYIFNSNDASGTISTSFALYGDDSDWSYPATLYQMNLDGTDRRLLTEFPANVSVDENVFEWKGNLVFSVKKTKTDDTHEGLVQQIGYDRKLVMVDSNSGKISDLNSISQSYYINGTYKDQLVCMKYIFPDGYTEESINMLGYDEWKSVMKRSEAYYFLYDIMTGQEKKICTFSCTDLLDDAIVFDGKIYRSTGGIETVCVDIESGQVSNIVMDESQAFTLVKSVGDRILCWPNGRSDQAYFWDPCTNELTYVDLSIKQTGLMRDLCVYNDNLIVGICDGDYEPSPFGDGSYDVKNQIFGLMKKSDLYSGNNYYIPVKMCSEGMIW